MEPLDILKQSITEGRVMQFEEAFLYLNAEAVEEEFRKFCSEATEAVISRKGNNGRQTEDMRPVMYHTAGNQKI